MLVCMRECLLSHVFNCEHVLLWCCSSIRQIIIGVDEQVTSLEKQCEDFAHDEKKISKQVSLPRHCAIEQGSRHVRPLTSVV